MKNALTLGNPVVIAVALLVAASVASAAEPASSKASASGLSMLVTLQRFRIHADHCSAQVPRLKPRFDGLMEDLTRRIQGISKGLLSSDAFKGVKDKPVPAEIGFAFEDSLNDARQNVERQDAESLCENTLRDLGGMDDDSLRADLTQALLAIQNMIRNLEKEPARAAPPDNRVWRSGSP